MVAVDVEKIEGFQFNSYSPETVGQIILSYLNGISYEKIPSIIPGTCSAQAQRIVAAAVERGTIPPESMRSKGRSSAPLETATDFARKHLEESAEYISRMTGVSIATAYRGRSRAREEAGVNFP